MGLEACDDGNKNDGVGCKPDCTGTLPGFSCTGGSPISPSVCSEVCGNLIMTPNEDCEDGNSVSLDGCSSSCHFESGW